MVGTDVLPINRCPFHKAYIDVCRGCRIRAKEHSQP